MARAVIDDPLLFLSAFADKPEPEEALVAEYRRLAESEAKIEDIIKKFDDRKLYTLSYAFLTGCAVQSRIPQSDKLAYDYLVATIAKRGNFEARGYSALASMYWSGRGPSGKPEGGKAYSALAKSAQLGYVFGQYEFAMLNHFGLAGGRRNYTKAEHWYKKAAEQGDAESMYMLGILYSDESQMQDKKTAASWFMKAAQADEGPAQASYNLGIMFLRGDGIDQNLEVYENFLSPKYIEYTGCDGEENVEDRFRRFISEEDKKANAKAAFDFYFTRAQKGDVDCQRAVGECYAAGRGVERSLSSAIWWLSKATSNEDNRPAFYNKTINLLNDLRSKESSLESHSCDIIQHTNDNGAERVTAPGELLEEPDQSKSISPAFMRSLDRAAAAEAMQLAYTESGATSVRQFAQDIGANQTDILRVMNAKATLEKSLELLAQADPNFTAQLIRD